MATPTCIKCGKHEFEVQIQKPLLSKFPIVFVQCAVCGGVVGVLDSLNLGEGIRRLLTKFEPDV